MSSLLTFIIPVRHQDNARDWPGLKARLAQTVASIANQHGDGDWRGIIVANERAELPGLPDRFAVERVSFPPNDMHERGAAGEEAFRDALRIDKGRRVLKGMLRARDSRFFMIADDDDLVSARIVQHVSAHQHGNGWKISQGYIWNDGGRLLLENDTFDRLCGTSLIIRSDLYGLPDRFEDASPEWIKTMLGSHIRIAGVLAERGTPLDTLPFRGAMYRVAHTGSHSRAPSLLYTYFLRPTALRQPGQWLRNASKLRWLGAERKREFFGKSRRASSVERRAPDA